MKPFNLEEAIQGKPLVTRDGRKILDFHYFKDSSASYPIIVVIEGRKGLVEYQVDGIYTHHCSSSPLDLFMYEEPKTYYINVYKSHNQEISLGYPFRSELDAKAAKQNDSSCIKTVEITIP